jgi:excinuclease ABC subunit A
MEPNTPMKTEERIAQSITTDGPAEAIRIQGARANNLKNLTVDIPKNELVLVTGLSGSGKSSLIMDTLYAEGQRRYVESLSSYARQFLNRMKKPEVDFIRGLCPAIAIQQRTTGKNARSTVGSLTEINDYLRLLFARVGRMYSPVSGNQVKKHQVSDVVDYVLEQEAGAKVQLWIDLPRVEGRSLGQELELLLQKGYTRFRAADEEEFQYIQDALDADEKVLETDSSQLDEEAYRVLIDRFVVREEDEENTRRMADSIHTAFMEGGGACIIDLMNGKEKRFNNRFALDGIEFPDLQPQLFNYNNPFGACQRCKGYGRILGISEQKVIPDPEMTIYEGAIACWSGPKGQRWLQPLLENAHEFDFPVHTPYEELSPEQQSLLWEGNSYFKGIQAYFDKLEKKAYKIQNRVILSRYRGRTTCPECNGSRLRKETQYVKIQGTTIQDLIFLPVDELHAYFKKLDLEGADEEIGNRILIELRSRLQTMVKIGLGYLTLERLSSTLSGGETQRIHLTRTLSSNLTHSMYILDEPSIGLHPQDSQQLIEVLKELRDLGNTVIVVEHEEELIRQADHLIELGPDAGSYGGELVYAGPLTDFEDEAEGSYTADYLSGRRQIERQAPPRPMKSFIEIEGATKNNVRKLDVKFPLHAMSVVTGVSGSGKSTLVFDIIHPALRQEVHEEYVHQEADVKSISGPLSSIDRLEYIDQHPIGRSSRSNPVTYIKAYDAIRSLYASRPLSQMRGYKAKHFSFNVDAGRCEACQGEGYNTVEMQFLADVKLLCDECQGQRFKDEVLEVRYKNKNIFELLEMSVDDAIDFFEERPDIAGKLQPLQDVGLGYITLGQSSNTLSGGEAQRVKLASYLAKENSKERILFIFDEPTTGLHFHDINKLLTAFDALIELGHTVIIVEHNMDVIKCADWIIDLGPGGGKHGGQLMYQGPLAGITEVEESATGRFLKPHIEK